ncbi:acyl-CoA dehydrogenase [Catellatospora tritici]|uniref:acyl-CoA dehydrogenase n=1 Tax=Catellatospora tritici TaxID=2851566 RepID=UPI001C2DAF8B|nr:acyl-CoA dehydrogenase [Catellatospora tritici]MBV1853647.1 acyl-CoA dehydrogenase [Catellatospora tritici]
MSHYRSNVRDLRFNLFEVLGTGAALGHGRFADLDGQTAVTMLDEVDRLATGVISDSYRDGDRNPPRYDPATYSVTMPESLRRAYRAYMDAEFWRLDLPVEAGGTAAPRALWWALIELVQGGNAPVYMYAGGPGFGGLLHTMGTPEQRRLAELMIENGWGATMVLTEPDAGSDVGAGRTRAVPQPDGSWHIEGVKRFITSAEHDMADNIMHFVLARPVDTPGVGGPGTKGLSMFLVPKFHIDPQTGQLGERNGVFVTNVEHKMGLKVSTTCELTFGAHGVPAKGWLVGEVHDGIAQMFKVIESARMQVGVKAIAALSTGYLNALDYARQRVQGADLTRMTDKTAPRVTIDHHPDVRRMLMLQKAYAEGLRAVYLYTADWLDRGHELGASVNDLLLPIVKGVGSERSYELLALSLQTLGGSGFLQDYPMEQYLRDTKIDTLYEGTTGIQGQDFFFRKVVRDREVAFGLVTGEIEEFVTGLEQRGELKTEAAALREALAEVRTMAATMLGWTRDSAESPAEIYRVGQNTTRLLMSFGDLLIGYLLTRQAAVAGAALAAGSTETAFYTGKLAVARFFATTVLPELSARRAVLERTDNALMDVPADAF